MDVKQAREWLARAKAVAVLTGAGISAESGVPTFRGAGGLWKQLQARGPGHAGGLRPRPRAGLAVVRLAPGTDRRRQAQPRAIARWCDLEIQKPHLHPHHPERGRPARPRRQRRRLEYHGDDLAPALHRTAAPTARTAARRCPAAAALRLRRGLRARAWSGSASRCRKASSKRPSMPCGAEVLLVVGTSAVVYPAAGLIPYARQAGVKVIEVNLEPTPYSDTVDCCLTGPAGEVCRGLCHRSDYAPQEFSGGWRRRRAPLRGLLPARSDHHRGQRRPVAEACARRFPAQEHAGGSGASGGARANTPSSTSTRTLRASLAATRAVGNPEPAATPSAARRHRQWNGRPEPQDDHQPHRRLRATISSKNVQRPSGAL